MLQRPRSPIVLRVVRGLRIATVRILIRHRLVAAIVGADRPIAHRLLAIRILSIRRVGRGDVLGRRGVGRRGGRRDGRRRGRVADEIHFTGPFGVPQIDGQDVERRVDFIDVDLLFGLGVPHNQPDAGRWRDRSTVLDDFLSARHLSIPLWKPTLSPNPHMRARMGCWTTCKDQMRPSWTVDTGARWSFDDRCSGPLGAEFG